jgi:molybdopterin/thiamine biosynthesis adenylyltransferase
VGAIRIPAEICEKVQAHFSRGGEQYAFLHARVCTSSDGPVFLVRDATLVPEEQVVVGPRGRELDADFLLDIINDAVRSGLALVEAHNHGGLRPRFSPLDKDELSAFVPYVLDSLPGRPYAATVWGQEAVYGEWYAAGGRSGEPRSITSVGSHLVQLISRHDDVTPLPTTFNRQLPWFSERGQRRLSRIRVGIVGLGGTGSHVGINLTYLGVRDFVLVDPDTSDPTSMNRLVTAAAADVGTPKVLIARRAIKSIAPEATVAAFVGPVQDADGLDTLKGVDVLFGCVDNDGARLILNELSLAYGIPYLDLGIGIDAEAGTVRGAGGRVAVVLPGGPCLLCMGEIDLEEAAYVLSSPEQQVAARAFGYVRGVPNRAPAVVSLNGAIAAAALNEFAVYFSALRPPHPLTVLDLLGVGRPLPAQWLTPSRVTRDSGCIHCATAWAGDASGIERYGIPARRIVSTFES